MKIILCHGDYQIRVMKLIDNVEFHTAHIKNDERNFLKFLD